MKQSKNTEKKETLFAVCMKDHKFGNGKNFKFDDKCPQCGSEIRGYESTFYLPLSEAYKKFKGIWKSHN